MVGEYGWFMVGWWIPEYVSGWLSYYSKLKGST